MKRLLYYLLFAVILAACIAKGNGIESSTEADSIVITDGSEKRTHQTPTIVINYTHSNQKTEPIDTCNVIFRSYHDGNVYNDTVIDDIAVKYRCSETSNPEDYIFSNVSSSEMNVYGEYIPVNYVLYGNKAAIMWDKVEKAVSRKDTILITRDLIARALSEMKIFDKKDTKLFGLSNLRFNEVRNDSMVFNLRFGQPDTDILYELELKFDKDSLGKSFTIKDITSEIWTFDDEYGLSLY